MTSEDDERCWQELIKDVRRLPHDKPPLSGRKTELRVVPKISPDRVYRGAALADIVIGGTDNIDANTARRFVCQTVVPERAALHCDHHRQRTAPKRRGRHLRRPRGFERTGSAMAQPARHSAAYFSGASPRTPAGRFRRNPHSAEKAARKTGTLLTEDAAGR